MTYCDSLLYKVFMCFQPQIIPNIIKYRYTIIPLSKNKLKIILKQKLLIMIRILLHGVIKGIVFKFMALTKQIEQS